MESKFNLKEGMSDEILWNELTNVGISGETKQEVQGFKEPGKDYYKKTGKPLHQVLMANTKYAVIRKNNVTIDPLGGISDNFSYYLCGINDEGQYFVRPLFTLPRFPETPNLQQVVDWVNRKDQGFLDRVQGDVLIKFIHKAEIPELVDEDKLKDEFRTNLKQRRNPQILFTRSVEPLQPLQAGNRELGFNFRSDRQLQSVGTFGISSEFLRTMATGNQLTIGEKKFRKINGLPIKLGNHKLWIEGSVFAAETEPMVALVGRKFVLQHPEHQVVEQVIPDHSVAILTAQRGRDFNLKDYLAQAFD